MRTDGETGQRGGIGTIDEAAFAVGPTTVLSSLDELKWEMLAAMVEELMETA